MEQRFGRAFGHVRIHSGSEAAASARALDAAAFTIGNSIVFDEHQYRPDTSRGRGLLAHELAHVAQQDGTSASGTRIGHAGSSLERDAEAMALAAARAQPVSARRRAPRQVMRAARTFSLTFDDGPHAAPLGGGQNLTENVLDALKAQASMPRSSCRPA